MYAPLITRRAKAFRQVRETHRILPGCLLNVGIDDRTLTPDVIIFNLLGQQGLVRGPGLTAFLEAVTKGFERRQLLFKGAVLVQDEKTPEEETLEKKDN
jgi:hypothetical protein